MWSWKGPWSMCGVLEPGITLPVIVSHYIPFSLGGVFIHLLLTPWLFGPSPVSPSLLWPTTTAIPFPPCARTGCDIGKAVVRCALQQSHCRHAWQVSSHLRLVGPQRIPVETQWAKPLTYPKSCTVWVLMWRLQSQGVVCLSLVEAAGPGEG